jgi:hypothetical protein
MAVDEDKHAQQEQQYGERDDADQNHALRARLCFGIHSAVRCEGELILPRFLWPMCECLRNEFPGLHRAAAQGAKNKQEEKRRDPIAGDRPLWFPTHRAKDAQ